VQPGVGVLGEGGERLDGLPAHRRLELGEVPWNVALIKQFHGTSSRAIVTVNELTGDIVTICTEPRPDDWAGCTAPL
jgi:hypothetical protein